MKKILIFSTLLIIMAGCAGQPGLQTPATQTPQANLPNPASLYCEQNGNKLEIRTAADGSQSGACIFPDGSECDEWAYFRGECGAALPSSPTPTLSAPPAAETSQGPVPSVTNQEVAGWWGVIKSNPPGAQFDDYFERQDLGQILTYGIDSLDPQVESQIKALRDSGKIVHLSGTLISDIPDTNGSQIQVERIEVSE